jgi:hypothetical protein
MRYSVTNNTNVSLFSNTVIDADGTLTLAYESNANGTAQLTIRATDADGAYVETSLNVDVSPQNDAPTLQQNTGLRVASGTHTITSGNLQVVDVDNLSEDIIFTVTSIGQNGMLLLDGSALFPGSTFTQEDIDNNRLSFNTLPTDTLVASGFTFEVKDASGADGGASSFSITIQADPSDVLPEDPEEPESLAGSTIQDPVTSEPEADSTATKPDLILQPVQNPPIVDPQTVLHDLDPAIGPDLIIRPLIQAQYDNTSTDRPLDVVDTTSANAIEFASEQTRTLQRGLDLMHRYLDATEEEQKMLDLVLADGLKGVGASLSAGYLAWSLRMGPLLVSVFTSMPMWTRFDPLPVVLASKRSDEEDVDDQQEAAAARILDSKSSTDKEGNGS